MKRITMVAALALCSACANVPQFSAVGKDEYSFTKRSNACAAGDPAAVLEDLKQEAAKFCAGRREVPKLTSETSEYGIPVVRCASAAITFKCE